MTVRNGPKPERSEQLDRTVLRLVVGLSDPEREGVLLPALEECGDIVIAERCLGADQVLGCLECGPVDAVLVSADLHRLTSGVLADLARMRIPLVILAPDPGAEHWQALPAIVLPSQADSDAVRQALAAVRGGQFVPPEPGEDPERSADVVTPADSCPSTVSSVITVASGHGSPGRTTVAVNLAVALAAAAPTILVEADLAGPSIAAYLDADPSRNLALLAHANPTTPEDWERAITQETQPIVTGKPNAALLCGVPKPEMTRTISVSFFERMLTELGRRYRYVVLDIGAEIRGLELAPHRAALALASQVLLVASADLVGLWHARAALSLLRSQLRLDPDRLQLVINRHDRRFHHSRTEIEWALGTPTAALIPYDHQRIQRALLAQRPLVLDGRGPACRALLDLAERIQTGSLTLPPEPADAGEVGWMRRLSRIPMAKLRRRDRASLEQEGGSRDDHPATARAERNRPFGLNLLDTGLFPDRDKAVANALAIFRRQFDRFWGPRMEDAFRFALLTLYEVNQALCDQDPTSRDRQHTILDVPALLANATYRRGLLGLVADPVIRAWWTGYFDPLDRRLQLEIANPVQTKVQRFAGRRAARAIVGQSRSTIDPVSWLRSGAIVIVNTAKGTVGDDTAALVGATLLNLVALAIGERARLDPRQREPVTLVVDEFHTMPGADYEAILAELAKYGANLVLATQTLAQLDRHDGEQHRALRATVFANLDGLFAFHTSGEDAQYLVPELGGEVDAQDLVALGEYQCYVKLSAGGERLPTFSVRLDPPPVSDPVAAAQLTTASVARYGRDAATIERDLASALAAMEAGRQPVAGQSGVGVGPDSQMQTSTGTASRRGGQRNQNRPTKAAAQKPQQGELLPTQSTPATQSEGSSTQLALGEGEPGSGEEHKP